jgi:hypothetical protein
MTQNVTLAGTDQWSDYTNSDPMGDIREAKKSIKVNTGMLPNALILDWIVADTLRYHPQLMDKLGYREARPGGLTNAEMATSFETQNVYIATCNYDAAKEGQVTDFQACWGKDAILAVIPPSAAPFQVSLGYRMQKSGKTPRRVYKYPINNPPDADAILVDDEYQFFISNPKAGFLFRNAIA